MKLRAGKLYSGCDAIKSLMEHHLPIYFRYRLVRLMASMEGEYKAVDAIRSKLVAKYGYPDKEDGSMAVPIDKRTAFYADFKDVLNHVIDIDWEPVSIDVLNDTELSVRDITDVTFLFTEFRDEEESLPLVVSGEQAPI